MLDDWKDVFNIISEVRFGPIIDNNGIKLFYDEDKEIKKNINNLSSMIRSEFDFRGIMIAGYAGAGKTTLLHYIKNNIDSEKYELFIINAEADADENGVIQDINNNFKYFYNELFEKIKDKKDKTTGEIAIKKILDNMFANIVYSNPMDVLRTYLNTYAKLCDDKNAFDSGLVKRLRIALDQIDLLDNAKMLEILQNSFTAVIHAKYIDAIISARPETLESAKRSLVNFFATNFGRFIEMKSVPAEFILKKRIEASSSNKIVPIALINSIFTESFCDLMNKIQNGNIRKTLLVYEDIMNVMPIYKGRDATNNYINFLLEHNYLDDLYKKINQNDSIPLIKIVFDALQYQAVVDDKFYRAMLSTVLALNKNYTGCSRGNMKKSIEFLKNNSLISESFDITDRYNLTPKGEVYKKLIVTDGYKKLFCKTNVDQIFFQNPFNAIIFS